MTKTVQEMIAVMQAYADGKPVEYWAKFYERWEPTIRPSWNWHDTDYRIATIPDTIDWSHVSDEFICMARCSYGVSMLFREEPIITGDGWRSSQCVVLACNFASYCRGTVDWKDSLVFRPGHEPKEDKA